MAVKKQTRKVNREGQRWTEDRPGMTLRLPIDVREAVTEESRVKGDLAKIVLLLWGVSIRKTLKSSSPGKAGLPLTNPQLLHVGSEARLSGPKKRVLA